MQTLQQKKAYLAELELQKARKESLPHLYGFKWYKWARLFFESTNRMNFLTAANQVSKSSTMIRKCIHWATETELWPKLWDTKPTQFWYIYPSKDVATIEYEEKWVKEFLPKDKSDPKYGWEEEYKNKQVYCIRFKSGVTVYFRSYEQSMENVQTATVYAIFCDEECPADRYSEFSARMFRTGGYYHNVFTATLGQEMWRLTMEEKGEYELFPDASKQQISMYDCMFYEDGSPSVWTEEKIKQIVNKCSSPEEVQRRIYGKFVIDKNKVYTGFQRGRNYRPGHPIPKGWQIWTGIDYGSGGEAHKSACVFLAVSKDFTKGRIFKGWRGDGETTTAGDAYRKYVELRGARRPIMQNYDPSAKDLGTIATRCGDYFTKAERSHEIGEQLLNTLFKTGMLVIYADDPELIKLVIEFENLKKNTLKINAKDDFIDAARYAVASVPWDFSCLDLKTGEVLPTPEEKPLNPRERYYKGLDREDGPDDKTQEEYDEANECYDYFGYDEPA